MVTLVGFKAGGFSDSETFSTFPRIGLRNQRENHHVASIMESWCWKVFVGWDFFSDSATRFL